MMSTLQHEPRQERKFYNPLPALGNLIAAPFRFVGNVVESTYDYLTTKTVSKKELQLQNFLQSRYRHFQFYGQGSSSEVQELFTVLCAAAESAPNPGGNPKPDPEDIKKMISILISLGCLTSSGGVLVAYEFCAYAWGAYNLTEGMKNMIKRIKDGEDVSPTNPENIIEWLDLISSLEGFSSMAITNSIVPLMKRGQSKEVLKMLANILNFKGVHMETLSKSTEIVFTDYQKKLQGMTKTQQQLEFIAILIHLQELGSLYGLK